ncbi:MAG TPA: helix-turn-helix domain-containing protein [Xanthomonadales bacterium]|nr:helix-turn-helix domain-containing protein [Xanthomonadales bacterium]
MATLLLILFLHGIFLALVLAIAGARQDPANRWLSGLTLAASALLLHFYFTTSGVTQNQAQLTVIFMPIWMLIAPLTFRYVQAFLRIEHPMKWRWIALPPLAGAAWILLFGYVPGAGSTLGLTPLSQTVLLYTFFWLMTAWFAFRSWLAIRDVQSTQPARFEQSPWHAAWLRTLMAGLVFYSALDMALTLSLLYLGNYPAWAGLVSAMTLSALLYSIGLLVVMPGGLLARAPWPGKRYQKAEIPGDVARELGRELEEVMKTQQPWLEESLDQQRLALMLGISPHQLSQLLNQHLGESFADFINRYRVDEAKRLLAEAGASRTVMDIGLEAGFASNATFYRAFRKHAGMTPREFLADSASSNVEPIRGKR